MIPYHPVFPVGPVNPVDPLGPYVPVNPVGPVGPVNPVGPVVPNGVMMKGIICWTPTDVKVPPRTDVHVFPSGLV